MNNRLRMMYSQSTGVTEPEGTENDVPESGLSAMLLGGKGVSQEIEASVKRMEGDELDRIMHELVRDVEDLSEKVTEQMGRLVDKLESTLERLAGFKKLANIQGDKTNSASQQDRKLSELSEILPHLVKMYRDELKAKREALCDLAHFNNRNVFLAITASWSHQAFIDRSLLSCLYALVV